MSDKLSINQEKLFNFLFAKIIELQTQSVLTNAFLQAVFDQRNLDTNISAKALFDPIERELGQPLLDQQTEKFVAELNSISDDFQNMIEDLLNR
tara:strand:+ start:1736 stop:2017 length:282 start_codon:yes stop_codon:yes gene_type:complete